MKDIFIFLGWSIDLENLLSVKSFGKILDDFFLAQMGHRMVMSSLLP
jgi:hypothetical protein